MVKVDVQDFGELCVPFDAYRVKGASTIWITRDTKELRAACGRESVTPEIIVDKFAYMAPCTTATRIAYDYSDRIEMSADRYGGSGVESNRDSARAGLVNNFQIKGIGPTPLLGEHPPELEWHYYGGMSIVDGVLEAINSKVFNCILPFGVVRARALIETGPRAAYMPIGD